MSLLTREGGSLARPDATTAATFMQLAQQQATRDAEISVLQQRLTKATSEATALRQKLLEYEMKETRAGTSIEYIRCLVLQLLQTEEAEHAALFPAIATCLQFTEADVKSVTRSREERANKQRFFLGSILNGRATRSVSNDGPTAEQSVMERQAAADLLCARVADSTAIETLVAAVQDCEILLQAQHAAAHQREACLSRDQAAQAAYADEQARAEAARAEEHLYLRNVLIKYLADEDHHAMFPVVALCLKLTATEVDAIKERKAVREREHGSLVRRLFGL